MKKVSQILTIGVTTTGLENWQLAEVMRIYNNVVGSAGVQAEIEMTGQQVSDLIDQLNPSQQRAILDADISEKVATGLSYNEVTKSDQQTTRAKIAMLMAWLIVGVTVSIVVFMYWGSYVDTGSKNLEWLNSGSIALIIGALTSVPAAVLGVYMRGLYIEHKHRLMATSGQTIEQEKKGVLDGLLNRSGGQ